MSVAKTTTPKAQTVKVRLVLGPASSGRPSRRVERRAIGRLTYRTSCRIPIRPHRTRATTAQRQVGRKEYGYMTTLNQLALNAVHSEVGGATTPALWDGALLDPPWRAQGGEKHYETLSIEQLITLRPALDALLTPDAWLFVWTTKGLIEDCKRLITTWGFQFHDFIVWTKPNRYGYGNPRIGIRRATEYLLVATRGDVRSHYRAQQDFFSARGGIHAEKPLVQHELIQRMIGPTARTVELFARTRYLDPDRPENSPPRWGAWGMELERCDVSLLPWGWPVPADFIEPDSATADTSAAQSTAATSKE